MKAAGITKLQRFSACRRYLLAEKKSLQHKAWRGLLLVGMEHPTFPALKE